MNHHSTLTAVLLAVSGVAAIAVGPSEGADSDMTNKADSPSKNGIQLSLAVPARVKAGLPVPLTIELRNTGTDTATYGSDPLDPDKVDWQLTTGDGKPVPLTLFGKKHFHPTELADKLARVERSFVQVPLTPKKSLDLSLANLALFHDLTLPGEYTLTVTASVSVGEDAPQTISLTTKPIRFTVIAP